MAAQQFDITVNDTTQTVYNKEAVDSIVSGIDIDTSDKMDKVPAATAGHIAVYDTAGQVVDGGDPADPSSPIANIVNEAISNNTVIDGMQTDITQIESDVAALQSDMTGKVPSVDPNWSAATISNNGAAQSAETIVAQVQAPHPFNPAITVRQRATVGLTAAALRSNFTGGWSGTAIVETGISPNDIAWVHAATTDNTAAGSTDIQMERSSLQIRTTAPNSVTDPKPSILVKQTYDDLTVTRTNPIDWASRGNDSVLTKGDIANTPLPTPTGTIWRSPQDSRGYPDPTAPFTGRNIIQSHYNPGTETDTATVGYLWTINWYHQPTYIEWIAEGKAAPDAPVPGDLMIDGKGVIAIVNSAPVDYDATNKRIQLVLLGGLPPALPARRQTSQWPVMWYTSTSFAGTAPGDMVMCPFTSFNNQPGGNYNPFEPTTSGIYTDSTVSNGKRLSLVWSSSGGLGYMNRSPDGTNIEVCVMMPPPPADLVRMCLYNQTLVGNKGQSLLLLRSDNSCYNNASVLDIMSGWIVIDAAGNFGVVVDTAAGDSQRIQVKLLGPPVTPTVVPLTELASGQFSTVSGAVTNCAVSLEKLNGMVTMTVRIQFVQGSPSGKQGNIFTAAHIAALKTRGLWEYLAGATPKVVPLLIPTLGAAGSGHCGTATLTQVSDTEATVTAYIGTAYTDTPLGAQYAYATFTGVIA